MQRLATLRNDRADIRANFYLMGPELFLVWGNTVGVATDESLRAIAPPVPPYDLRSVVADSAESMFLWTGLKDCQIFAQLFKEYCPNWADGTLLDFGAGCGRMTRFFGALSSLKVFGTDVNLKLSDWCHANLSKVSSFHNEALPPLCFETGMFDFVYSMSIFTHLPESSARLWLEELVRITRPGGTIILTTHGYHALRTIKSSELHQRMFRLTEESTVQIMDRFEDEPYVFLELSAETLKMASAGTNAYGKTFVHENYIRSTWPQAGLDLLTHIPGAVRGWQDATVLRKPSSSQFP